MPFIRTILGDIAPEHLGVCYAHEHVIIDPSLATKNEPDFLLDDVDRAVEELRAAYSVGVRAMIDTMPGGAGRNAIKLTRVSRESRVHIICPTGMHLAKYYRSDDPLLALDANALAAWFVREISEGMTEAPQHRAGVIKVASGPARLSEQEKKVFAATAVAHRETGCPIITHTEQGTAGMEQVDLFEAAGVDLTRLTLSHTDRLPDIALHRALLRRGVKLEYDSCFRWKPDDGNPSLALMLELVPEFPTQLMLGMDAARRRYWQSYGGAPGLSFLYTTFAQQLRDNGLSSSQVAGLFLANPAKAFSFASASHTAKI
jgi:phosphotriesterase-related protein